VIKTSDNCVFSKADLRAMSLLKLGSLEKTIIASLFHSGLHSGTIFLWKKDAVCYFGERQVMPFFDRKKTKKIYGAKLIV
jgi:hypothetical protein